LSDYYSAIDPVQRLDPVSAPFFSDDGGAMRMAVGRATPDTSKLPILAAVCLAALVLPLSFSGGAVATPAIGRDLGGSPTALNWITNAFMLTFGSSLMAAGALADQFGRKRVFLTGIIAFATVSLALSLAPSILILDILRAAQGFAAAAALSGARRHWRRNSTPKLAQKHSVFWARPSAWDWHSARCWPDV
jgi:MFS family permease